MHIFANVQDESHRYYLTDCGKVPFGQHTDWHLSGDPEWISADAILVKQAFLDKTASFQDSKGSCLLTMSADGAITWRSKTYR